VVARRSRVAPRMVDASPGPPRLPTHGRLVDRGPENERRFATREPERQCPTEAVPDQDAGFRSDDGQKVVDVRGDVPFAGNGCGSAVSAPVIGDHLAMGSQVLHETGETSLAVHGAVSQDESSRTAVVSGDVQTLVRSDCGIGIHT